MFKTLLLGSFAGPMVRHGATVLGGWLIASGHADETTAQQITGGVVAAAGLALSWLDKELR